MSAAGEKGNGCGGCESGEGTGHEVRATDNDADARRCLRQGALEAERMGVYAPVDIAGDDDFCGAVFR